jgi:hypothetical protein
MSERLSFSGHQTFPFRYAWLPKGVAGVVENPRLFADERALVHLGVGKNMVAAIRHWCEATGMIGQRAQDGCDAPTPLGRAIFTEAPWDPFLEDIGTLWLLHWQLARFGSRASTWHLAFTRWNRAMFTRDDLVGWLHRLASLSRARSSSIASIRRDVDVFLRTYIPRVINARVIEDSFDCPLAELGLIDETDSGIFEFRRSGQDTLPVAVFAYAVLDYWHSTAPDQSTLSYDRLLFGAGSPGGAFQLSDAGLTHLLEGLPSKCGVVFDESAGMRRLVRSRHRLPEPFTLLAEYYQSRG